MNFDIELWLVRVTLVMLVIWAADRIWRAAAARRMVAAAVPDAEQAPVQKDPVPAPVASVVEFSNGLLPVLLVVLVVRSFLFEPFTIPSGSMLPTLQVHDFVLVNKYAYGVRLPVWRTEMIPVGDPERGDIMVFRYPEDPSENYIKRVVGIPGDEVRLINESVYINGEKVESRLLDTRVLQDDRSGLLVERRTYAEMLGDSEHLMQHEIRMDPLTNRRTVNRDNRQWTVPEDAYFVMGDNRENSKDSRFWGFVPEQNIVGKATAIWMHWEGFSSLPSFSRNGAIDKAESMQ
jgi:signal peptidase I